MPVLLLFLVHSTLDELNASYFYQWYFLPYKSEKKKITKVHQIPLGPSTQYLFYEFLPTLSTYSW